MRTHVALLRGINVVGRNKVSMTDLRAIVEGLGHKDVVTYIQSGNVAFSASEPAATGRELARVIEAAIAKRLGVRPAVIVVARSELAAVWGDNPFHAVADPKTLHAVFLPDAPDRGGLSSVAGAVERARARGSRDDAQVVGRVLYLWTPDGFARSVLRAELDRGGARRSPMPGGTARNWATVKALLSLLEE